MQTKRYAHTHSIPFQQPRFGSFVLRKRKCQGNFDAVTRQAAYDQISELSEFNTKYAWYTPQNKAIIKILNAILSAEAKICDFLYISTHTNTNHLLVCLLYLPFLYGAMFLLSSTKDSWTKSIKFKRQMKRVTFFLQKMKNKIQTFL